MEEAKSTENQEPAKDQMSSPSSSSSDSTEEEAVDELDENFVKSKQIIKDHPMYPVVEYLFRKCEEATVGLGAGNVDRNEVETILRRQLEINGGSLFSADKDVDNLLLTAIQHLRLQHHELQKVDELCDHFLERYLSCLKSKISQETLLGWSDCDSDSASPPVASAASASGSVATMQIASGGSISVTLPYEGFETKSATAPRFPCSPSSSTMMNNASSASSIFCLPPMSRNNLTVGEFLLNAMSNYNAQLNKSDNGSVQSPNSTEHMNLSDNTAMNYSMSIEMDSGGDSCDGAGQHCKPKRGSLPRRSVEFLRSWLFQHIMHPYPSENEKRLMSAETGLNLIQVNNWFINARRRILQPLLEGNERPKSADNPESRDFFLEAASSSYPRRKSFQGKTIASKHWPESMVEVDQQFENHKDQDEHESSLKKRRMKRPKTSKRGTFSDHETSDDDETFSAADSVK